jgi:hypothetical protein
MKKGVPPQISKCLVPLLHTERRLELPMYSIQQESLFSLQDLLELSPKDTYGYLFETVDINPFLRVVSKKAFLGAPTQLNYAAMLH